MRERWLSYVVLCLLMAPTLVGCTAPRARGWSNGGYSSDPANPDYGTHDWIADEALAIQVRDVTFLLSTYHSRYLIGTEAPDNPDHIGDSTNHHLYYYSSGAVQDDKCAVRASQMYTVALERLTAGDYNNAAYNIGAMVHYISDVGVFGHTMGTATDWGAEVHHSDYENGIDSRIGSLESPSGISLGNEDAYSATIGLAYDVTFGQGAIMSNVWMDANYDWADKVFVASAMSSLTSSVAAVAAAINHLMIEAAPEPPPDVPPSPQSSPPFVPQPPTSLTATLVDSHVVLTWSPPANDGGSTVTAYTILRTTGSESNPVSTILPGTSQSWIDESVEKGKTYNYWVLAQNSAGVSIYSKVASVTVPGDSSSWGLPIALSAIITVVIASGAAMMWRRKVKGKTAS